MMLRAMLSLIITITTKFTATVFAFSWFDEASRVALAS